MTVTTAPTEPWLFSGDKFLEGLMRFAATKEGRKAIDKVPRSATLDAKLRNLQHAASNAASVQRVNLRTVLAVGLIQ